MIQDISLKSPYTGSVPPMEERSVREAIRRTREWLLSQQHAEGYWVAELEGDTILESETILLLAFLGREDSEFARRAAQYLLEKQLPDGGWAMYPGGGVEISGSVKAYFALKLAGHEDPEVRKTVLVALAGYEGDEVLQTVIERLSDPHWSVRKAAVEALKRWSTSVDLFARLVPGVTVVPVAVSGVFDLAPLMLTPGWYTGFHRL